MSKIKKFAELTMALALADQVLPQTKEGRLKFYMQKLHDACMEELRKMPKATASDIKKAEKIIMRFTDLTGWLNKPLHLCTKINFLLCLYDNKPYAARIITALNAIYEYYERAKDAPAPCLWSAALAAEKWKAALNA